MDQRTSLKRSAVAPKRFARWLEMRIQQLDISYAEALELTTEQWHKLELSDKPPEVDDFRRLRKTGTTNADKAWNLGRAVRAVELERGVPIEQCVSGIIALLAAGAYIDFSAVAALQFINDNSTDGSAGAWIHRICGATPDEIAKENGSSGDVDPYLRLPTRDIIVSGVANIVETPDYDRCLLDPAFREFFGIRDDSSFVSAYKLWKRKKDFDAVPEGFHQPILTFSHRSSRKQDYGQSTALGINQLRSALFAEREQQKLWHRLYLLKEQADRFRSGPGFPVAAIEDAANE